MVRNALMLSVVAAVAVFALFSASGMKRNTMANSVVKEDAQVMSTDYTPLKDVVAGLTSGYSVGVGGVINIKKFAGDATYDDLLCKNFDWLTAENGCKWRYTLSDDPVYERCDAALEFAEKCNQTFRGHALVWGQEGSNPNWLQPSNDEYGNWTVDEKRQIIIDHITEHMNRYAGRITYYDVVNEAVCDCISWTGSKYTTCEEYIATEAGAEKCGYSTKYNAYLKRNVFWPDIEDYIGLSFTTAREVDSTAKLGYNEYKFESSVGYGTNGGFLKEKGISVYNLTKALVDEGIPIDYVGSQTHIDLGYLTDFDGYIDSVKNYSKSIVDLGVEWHYTEVTVATPSATTEYMSTEEQTNQATLYAGLLQSCVDLGPSACPVFQMWGAADNYTAAYDGLNPYLFDVANAPKLSYTSFVGTLENASVCVSDWGNCKDNSMGCCSDDYSCYKKDDTYSQCRTSCPDNSAWECYECTANWGDCTSVSKCCEEGYSCYKKHDNYAQCRKSCPESDDWECHTGMPTFMQKKFKQTTPKPSTKTK